MTIPPLGPVATGPDERTLDWGPRFDKRSKNFAISAGARKLRATDWAHGPVLDQGREGACVGFAAVGVLTSTKRQYAFSDGGDVARNVYHAAQRVDEFEGENYEGTSVLAGMKVLKADGWIKRYEWAFNVEQALWALSWRGPLQLGVYWYEGMWDTDAEGFIAPTGRVVGGHSIMASGVNQPEGYVVLTNSWGPRWGRGGQAKVRIEDFQKLLDRDGEAVSVVKVPPHGVVGV